MYFLRYCKLIILGIFGMPEKTHLKLWRHFRVFLKVHSHLKKQENSKNDF